MRGGPAGRGLRGGPGGIDLVDPVPDWRYFRKSDAGGAAGHVYVPGLDGTLFRIGSADSFVVTNVDLLSQIQDATAGERLYAVPEVFQRATRIQRVLQYVDSALAFPADNKIRCGIYDNAGTGNPYPQNLLWDSGDVELTAGGVLHTVSVSPALGVTAGSLLWFVFSCTAAARTNRVLVRGLQSASIFPLLGCPQSEIATPGTPPRFGVGWRHDYAYGAMPSRFPSSSPVVHLALGAVDTPIWFYGAEILG